MIRTILTPLTGGENSESAGEAAARVARAFNSHLIGLHVRADPAAAVPFIADGLTADIVQELVSSAEREGDKRSARAREIFDRICAHHDIPLKPADPQATAPSAEWLERQGIIGDTVGRLARIADLTVVPQPAVDVDPMTASLLDDVLSRSGRAIMMAPRALPERFAESVLIAWNGSAEAARAVADAMAFITRAKTVIVLTVGELKAERPDGGALAHSLRCHGVEPELMQAASGGGGVGATILEAAASTGASLLILGAYSHSRWREFMLGGVTRLVIEKAPLPVLMSH
ncbi:MAG: universal stress protein [Pseudomonadota bacterium]